MRRIFQDKARIRRQHGAESTEDHDGPVRVVCSHIQLVFRHVFPGIRGTRQGAEFQLGQHQELEQTLPFGLQIQFIYDVGAGQHHHAHDSARSGGSIQTRSHLHDPTAHHHRCHADPRRVYDECVYHLHEWKGRRKYGVVHWIHGIVWIRFYVCPRESYCHDAACVPIHHHGHSDTDLVHSAHRMVLGRQLADRAVCGGISDSHEFLRHTLVFGQESVSNHCQHQSLRICRGQRGVVPHRHQECDRGPRRSHQIGVGQRRSV